MVYVCNCLLLIYCDVLVLGLFVGLFVGSGVWLVVVFVRLVSGV